jgi:hypothetical protein
MNLHRIALAGNDALDAASIRLIQSLEEARAATP